MKTLVLIIFSALFLLPCPGFCQEIAFVDELYFDYEDIPLQDVFDDMNNRYGLDFSYSRNFIDETQKVTATADGLALEEAMNTLFAETRISCWVAGTEVLLRVEDNDINGFPARAITAASKKEGKLSGALKKNRLAGKKISEFDAIEIPKPSEVKTSGKQSFKKFELESLLLPDSSTSRHQLVQLSILPNIGTNANDSYMTTHKISANIFWGANGGVNGLEVGFIGNTVVNDVKGLQVAGICNYVRGDMHGTQVSGAVNSNRLNTKGVQVAGLANFNRHTNAIQSAGLFNYVDGHFTGIQIAGLGNIVKEKANALQIAGLFNFNKGRAKTQIGGILNHATDVEKSQFGGLLNIAGSVEGNQVGLINFANTVHGTTFGLINIVRKGYNVIELSADLAMDNKLSVKMGTKGFYNIFQLGKSYRKNAWGLGYGIGTSIRVNNRFFSNAEVSFMHINENEAWTKPLNLLTQLRYTIDYQVHKKWHLFIGPDLSLLSSRVKLTDSNIVGSDLPVYYFVNKNINDTNLKMWVGFAAGLRYQL